MEIDGQIEVDAPRETVVEEMQEPDVLQRAIPNCEDVTQVDEFLYEARVTERISMISLDMDMEIAIEEYEPPESFVVMLDGTAPGSNTDVNAEMDFQLFETDDGGTRIEYFMDIEVSGKLASLGFRMLKSTVTKRIDQMADNIEEIFSEQQAST